MTNRTGGAGTGGSGVGTAGTGGSATGDGGRGGGGGAGRGGSGVAGRGGSTGTAGASGTAGAGGGGRGGSAAANRHGRKQRAAGTSGGTCTASQTASPDRDGTGPHKVVIETNSAQGIKCGTIYRPADLRGTEKYPIFVWGEGGCSQDGYSNVAAMAEIASWDTSSSRTVRRAAPNACSGGQDGKAFLDYLTWAIAENGKSCSAYYQALDTTKIAADGFSCGGLMSENVLRRCALLRHRNHQQRPDEREQQPLQQIHTPWKIMNGGSSDIAYENGLRDYQQDQRPRQTHHLFLEDSATAAT